MIRRFLESEAALAGWRFFVLWVLASNAAFFPGLALGETLASGVAEPFASGVVAFSFAMPVGLLQWLVLRRHLPGSASWVLATGLGWALGALAGATLLVSSTSAVPPGGATWILALGFFCGAAVGLAQLPLMLRALPELARWWVPISALAWGLLFPGVVTGLFLSRSLTPRSA